MINLMEATALSGVEHLLPAGHQSLGFYLDVSHVAANARRHQGDRPAAPTSVEGRTIAFKIEARDERQAIGGGAHRRVLINNIAPLRRAGPAQGAQR